MSITLGLIIHRAFDNGSEQKGQSLLTCANGWEKFEVDGPRYYDADHLSFRFVARQQAKRMIFFEGGGGNVA